MRDYRGVAIAFADNSVANVGSTTLEIVIDGAEARLFETAYQPHVLALRPAEPETELEIEPDQDDTPGFLPSASLHLHWCGHQAAWGRAQPAISVEGQLTRHSAVRIFRPKTFRCCNSTDVDGGEPPAAVHHGNQGMAAEAVVQAMRSVKWHLATQIGRLLGGEPIATMWNGNLRNIVRATVRDTSPNRLRVSRD